MYKLSMLLFVFIFSVNAQQDLQQLALINPTCVQKSHTIKNAQLFTHGENFVVAQDNKLSLIKNHDIDPLLKKFGSKNLDRFLKHGYLELNQCTNGDYTLKANVRGVGGGPLTGSFLYWLTKTVCYGGAAAAIGGTVAATGGAAAAVGTAVAGSAGAAVGGGAVAATTYVASGSALGVATATFSTVSAAGAIAAIPGGTAAASLATGATIAASGGCIATAMAAVETASKTHGISQFSKRKNNSDFKSNIGWQYLLLPNRVFVFWQS
jgi:hypothetical protein